MLKKMIAIIRTLFYRNVLYISQAVQKWLGIGEGCPHDVQQVMFDKDLIELDIPDDGKKFDDGWKITPMSHFGVST